MKHFKNIYSYLNAKHFETINLNKIKWNEMKKPTKSVWNVKYRSIRLQWRKFHNRAGHTMGGRFWFPQVRAWRKIIEKFSTFKKKSNSKLLPALPTKGLFLAGFHLRCKNFSSGAHAPNLSVTLPVIWYYRCYAFFNFAVRSFQNKKYRIEMR